MNLYFLLKIIHLIGVILFLGNIIVTAWWKYQADQTKEPNIVAFAQRQVILTDFIFTLVGVFLVLVGGFGIVFYTGINLLQFNWVSLGLIIFSISGLIWMFILIPLQSKMSKLSKKFENSIPEEYNILNKKWFFWGTIAIILPLLNLIFMIFKPNFQ